MDQLLIQRICPRIEQEFQFHHYEFERWRRALENEMKCAYVEELEARDVFSKTCLFTKELDEALLESESRCRRPSFSHHLGQVQRFECHEPIYQNSDY